MKVLRLFMAMVASLFASLAEAVPALRTPPVVKRIIHPWTKRAHGTVVQGAATGLAFGLLIATFALAAHFLAVPGALLAFPAVLVAKRNELEAKRKDLDAVFEAAGPDLDFNKSEVLKLTGATNSAGVVEKVRAKNAELDVLAKEVEELAEMDGVRNRLGSLGADLDEPARQRQVDASMHADPGARGPIGIGQAVVDSDAFKNYRDTGDPTKGEIANYGIREIRNTLFETGAGWAPESLRSGRVVEARTRPIQVIDIIPMGNTDQAAYVYMEETTRTHAAGETAEGGLFKESTFALTEKTSNVRKITDSVPVTDEQLEDVAGIRSYLDGRLSFGLRQRFDGQTLVGDGLAPNLEGITNVTGIQTQAKGTDPTPDAFYKAMTKIRVTGRAFPTHALMHPNDWQEIRLLRTSEGVYIWGNPSEAGPERLWGLPVVQTDVLTEGTGLVGSFDPAWVMAFEKRGVEIQVGYVGTQFAEGKRTIRADMRLAFVVFRPAAFATVTGI